MIEVKNLDFSYKGSNRVILKDVSFDIKTGHRLAVMGNNGSGKSTLIKCINKILEKQKGSVHIDDTDINEMSRRELAKKIAYVPQKADVSHMMVYDAVLMGRKPYIKWDAGSEDRRIVDDLIEKFELRDYKARYVDELSGGELQKVILARAMAQQPDYILMDEPTASLDPHNQHEMLKKVNEIASVQNLGIVIVIHDLNLAMRYCDRFLFIKDSGIYSMGGLDTVTEKTIMDVYNLQVDMIVHDGNKVAIAK